MTWSSTWGDGRSAVPALSWLVFQLLQLHRVALHQRRGPRAFEPPLRGRRVLVTLHPQPPQPLSTVCHHQALCDICVTSSPLQDVVLGLPASVLPAGDLQLDAGCPEWRLRFQVGSVQVRRHLASRLHRWRLQELHQWVALPGGWRVDADADASHRRDVRWGWWLVRHWPLWSQMYKYMNPK